MAITGAYIQNINPQFAQPGQTITKLDQVQATVTNADPAISQPMPGGAQLFAIIPGTNGGPAQQVLLATADIAAGGNINFNGPINLTGLGEVNNVQFVVKVNDGTMAQPFQTQPWGNSYNVVCFLAGTRIRTPSGEVPIESLRIGDLVLTADGRAEPVRFVGRQDFATRFADRDATWPVRLRAGALGAGLPAVDLMLSPGHCLHFDGVLVTARALVNGTTIDQRRPAGDSFSYFNLELDRHEVILAEGAEVESFADNVSRMSFHNHADFVALYPAGREVGEMDLPRAVSARQVPAAIRRRIDSRAVACGFVAAADRAA